MFFIFTSFGLLTLSTSALERDAANNPAGESSTINVSSGNTPIIDIAFQYISGCGLPCFTSSFDIIKSNSSIKSNLDNIVNTERLMAFEQQANLYPLCLSSWKVFLINKLGCIY